MSLVTVAWGDYTCRGVVYFYYTLDEMLVYPRVTPPLTNYKFFGINLYNWVERGTMRVYRLAQEHNTMTLPLRPLNPVSSTPTTRLA